MCRLPCPSPAPNASGALRATTSTRATPTRATLRRARQAARSAPLCAQPQAYAPRSARPAAGARPMTRLRTKTDALVAVLYTDVYDLAEVEAHRAFLGSELVPAAIAERLVQRLQLLVGDAQREHLTALESDADASVLMGHQ